MSEYKDNDNDVTTEEKADLYQKESLRLLKENNKLKGRVKWLEDHLEYYKKLYDKIKQDIYISWEDNRQLINQNNKFRKENKKLKKKI